jgi:2,4-dienoyl-CoA reductase-like NADH-dependent reductase (Old Yellow Enzyme family)
VPVAAAKASFAAGGAGLVIMESTKVERRGCGTVGDLHFIPGLRRSAEFIRRKGAVPGIQLGHFRPEGAPREGGAPLKPSMEPLIPNVDDRTMRVVPPGAHPVKLLNWLSHSARGAAGSLLTPDIAGDRGSCPRSRERVRGPVAYDQI